MLKKREACHFCLLFMDVVDTCISLKKLEKGLRFWLFLFVLIINLSSVWHYCYKNILKSTHDNPKTLLMTWWCLQLPPCLPYKGIFNFRIFFNIQNVPWQRCFILEYAGIILLKAILYVWLELRRSLEK